MRIAHRSEDVTKLILPTSRSKMRVSREELLSGLEQVQPALAPRNLLEQSTSFIFKDGEVFTYDGEVACRTYCPIEGISVAVKAKPLLDYLRKLKEDEIEVILEDNELIFEAGREVVTYTVEHRIVLPISEVPHIKNRNYVPLNEGFCDALSVVAACAAGKKEESFAFRSVHLHPEWMEACDRKQICRWDVGSGLSEPILIRASDAKKLAPLGVIKIYASDNWLHFKNTCGTQFSCRRYLESYPDCSKFLAVEGTKLILPSSLQDTIKRAEVFSAENADEEKNILLVEINKKKLKIKSRSAVGSFSRTISLDYQGDPFSFLVSPEVLLKILQKGQEIEVSGNALKLQSVNYHYVTAIGKPAE